MRAKFDSVKDKTKLEFAPKEEPCAHAVKFEEGFENLPSLPNLPPPEEV